MLSRTCVHEPKSAGHTRWLAGAPARDQTAHAGATYHFPDCNERVPSGRASSLGLRLNIAAGTAVPAAMFSRNPSEDARPDGTRSLQSGK
ncbi:urease subunit beta [Burkholderia pseudomallei]|uniref:urease subunit beta n=1 Tax=Burkholderia pseudomallei TaxID=28450 RepID=UPI0011AECDE7